MSNFLAGLIIIVAPAGLLCAALFKVFQRFSPPWSTGLKGCAAGAVTVTAIALIRRFFPLRGTPLRVFSPPREILRRPLNRSSVTQSPSAKRLASSSQQLILVTEDVKAKLAGRPNVLDMRACVSGVSTDPEVMPGIKGEHSSRAEIQICFSLQNASHDVATVFDMSAHLYHVSSGFLPLSTAYEPRHWVELRQDNSIMSNERVFQIQPGGILSVRLALDTSFLDDTATTLMVFGLFAYGWQITNDNPVKFRVPSDKLYVLTHVSPLFGKGEPEVKIKAIDETYIRRRKAEQRWHLHWLPDGSGAQTQDAYTIFTSFEKMLKTHTLGAE